MRQITLRSALVPALGIISFLFLGSTLSIPQDAHAGSADGVYEVAGHGVTPPKPINTPDPSYTDRARKRRIKGTVLISMVVTPEGTVRDPKVTTSLDRDLDRQALAAVSTWKFEPATKDGRPVAFRVRTSVTFNLY